MCAVTVSSELLVNTRESFRSRLLSGYGSDVSIGYCCTKEVTMFCNVSRWLS